MPTMPGTPAIPVLPEMANRVCCLYRVSTTKQVDIDEQNQADIPVQRKACRDYAEKMGWVIVKEEKEAGVSGFKVSANDRDKIQLIKEYAEKGDHFFEQQSSRIEGVLQG